ncbi:MAG: response regulator transcription factor [Phycisphaeraceae bacterium]
MTAVVLVDDHAMMRAGIRSILEHEETITVVGEANDGREAIELTARVVPDVVLIDVGMPGLNGIEATRKILAEDPKVSVIALSMHSDERYLHGMLEAGARGYLLKTCGARELILAIETVQRGQIYITSELTHLLVDRRYPRAGQVQHGGSRLSEELTPREREVLQLIAEGQTSKQISIRLGTAMKTIESHRTNLIQKLDLHSIADLTKYALREGLIQLSD